MKKRNKDGFTRGMKRALNNYRWWDYCHMLDMEYEIWKHWLEVYTNEKKYHVMGDSPERKYIAKRALSLLDIIRNSVSIIEPVDTDDNFNFDDRYILTHVPEYKLKNGKYVNIKNARRFLNQSDIDCLHIKEGECDGFGYDEVYNAKAWHLYNKLREQYLRCMWD